MVTVHFSFYGMTYFTQFLNIVNVIVQMVTILVVQICDAPIIRHFTPIHHTCESQSAIHIFTSEISPSHDTWSGSTMSVAGCTQGPESDTIMCTWFLTAWVHTKWLI